jgi:hypothetical protein
VVPAVAEVTIQVSAPPESAAGNDVRQAPVMNDR